MARFTTGAAGRYRLCGALAKGCQSVIYEVEALSGPQAGARLALKLAKSGGGARTALLRDAFVRARVQGERVIPLLDFATDRGRPFIVLELVQGRSLDVWARSLAASDPRARAASVLGLMIQVCEALTQVHRARDEDGRLLEAFHGDLHPSNVLIDAEERVKLTDFGCAHCPRLEELLGPPTDLGWAHGLAPERALGTPVDQRVDLFAAGALLYSCLAGRDLYDESQVDDLSETVRKADTAPALDRLADLYSAPLVDLARRALDPRPDGRFQTAEEMERAIRATLRTLAP